MEAAGAFLAAAIGERDRYHYQTALDLIDQGLDLTGDRKEKARFLFLQGEVYHDFGRMSEAEQAYQAMLAVVSDPIDHCHALFGLAGVKRVTDKLDEALEHLGQAQRLAEQEQLVPELSQIHFLRGNVLFPLGEVEKCLAEHEEGLRLARQAGRQDLQAASLGGLGDAEYLRGRMASARARLEECVRLAAEQRLGLIEVANKAQIGHTLIYTASQHEALQAGRDAIELATSVGHTRAEINARVVVQKTLFALNRLDECLMEIEKSVEVVNRLGARRFLQHSFLFSGRIFCARGQKAESEAAFEEGLALAQDTGFAFNGPRIASAYAILAENPERKIELLDIAESAIKSGCVGHNQFWAYADGIDVGYMLGDAVLLQKYVDLIDAYPEGETVSWSNFHTLRGQALLGHLTAPASDETRMKTGKASEFGRSIGMHFWLADEPFRSAAC